MPVGGQQLSGVGGGGGEAEASVTVKSGGRGRRVERRHWSRGAIAGYRCRPGRGVRRNGAQATRMRVTRRRRTCASREPGRRPEGAPLAAQGAAGAAAQNDFGMQFGRRRSQPQSPPKRPLAQAVAGTRLRRCKGVRAGRPPGIGQASVQVPFPVRCRADWVAAGCQSPGARYGQDGYRRRRDG
jgi:hypothetical protein